MLDSTFLVVTSDKDFVEILQQQIHDQSGGGCRMIVASTIDEACSLLTTALPRVVVVHWTRQAARFGQLDRLLWTTSVLSRRIPVLVIADRYRTDQATTLYRMGVAEYISRSHHLDQFGQVLAAYVPHSAAPIPVALTPADPAGLAVKAWAPPQPTPAVSAKVV